AFTTSVLLEFNVEGPLGTIGRWRRRWVPGKLCLDSYMRLQMIVEHLFLRDRFVRLRPLFRLRPLLWLRPLLRLRPPRFFGNSCCVFEPSGFGPPRFFGNPCC
ncbi:unnamed protein product, partial [Ectocarpus sp. 8 AP-2014]